MKNVMTLSMKEKAMDSRTSLRTALALFLGLLTLAPPVLAIGARPRAMGGAFIAVADDENAMFSNPAGLFQIDHSLLQMGVSVANRDDFISDHFAYVGRIFRTVEKQRITLEDYLESDFELRTRPERVSNYSYGLSALRENRSLRLNQQRGMVPATDDDLQSFQASLATRFPIAERLTRRPELYGGMTIRYNNFDRSIPSLGAVASQNTLDMDLSLFYRANHRFNIGLKGQNVVSWKTGSSAGVRDNAFVTNLGFAYTFGKRRDTIVAWDFMNIFDTNRGIKRKSRLGIERQFLDNDFALRIGTDGGVLTLGWGVQFFKDFKLDYAFFNGAVVKDHFVSLRLPF